MKKIFNISFFAFLIVSCSQEHTPKVVKVGDQTTISRTQELFFDNLEAHKLYNRGLEYLNKKEYLKAHKFLIAADSIETHKNVLSMLGIVSSRLGNSTNAFACFEKAIDIDTTFGEAYINYGRWLNEFHKYEKAKLVLQNGLLIPNLSALEKEVFYFNLAKSFFNLREHNTALQYLDSADMVNNESIIREKKNHFRKRIETEKKKTTATTGHY